MDNEFKELRNNILALTCIPCQNVKNSHVTISS